MSAETKQLVSLFYNLIWNQHEPTAANTILAKNFQFKGSLGTDRMDSKEFLNYVNKVHHSLSNYHCEIDELVCEHNKAFAKMQFSGVHSEDFLGFEPTGKTLSWSGAALFSVQHGKIHSAWVLGDLTSLKQQLTENSQNKDFVKDAV